MCVLQVISVSMSMPSYEGTFVIYLYVCTKVLFYLELPLGINKLMSYLSIKSKRVTDDDEETDEVSGKNGVGFLR